LISDTVVILPPSHSSLELDYGIVVRPVRYNFGGGAMVAEGNRNEVEGRDDGERNAYAIYNLQLAPSGTSAERFNEI
jgi:hypothetical protein